MVKPFSDKKFVDFIITETKPSFSKQLLGDYKICSITKNGRDKYINLRVPAEIQQKILSAYSQGKQVRIFA